MMEEKIKKAGMQISIYMGVTMSFFLSLLGNLLSGHFTLILFLVTFAASTTVCYIIALLIPLGLLTEAATKKLKQDGFPANCLASLISDIIYTPLLTLIMIVLVRMMLPAEARSYLPPFIKMYIGSLIPSFIAGFFLVLVFMPLFRKMVLKNLGLDRPHGPQAPEE